MRKQVQFRPWIAISLMAMVLVAGCGIAPDVKRAGRSDQDKQTLIKPGMFGNNAAADRLRGRFDFWNEEVIREDVAVGTVFLGDSITELWQLDAYFMPADGIILNRGIGGDITPHIAKRLDADVVQLRPRNVVILAGTNDVARMLETGKNDAEIIDTVMTNKGPMMDAAKAARINVLICSILPTNPDTRNHEGKARLLPQINEKLKALCATKGCIYVDYASKMKDAAGMLPKTLARDGLHPHYAGYEIMAQCVKEAAGLNGLRL